jgi:hypothetical protein
MRPSAVIDGCLGLKIQIFTTDDRKGSSPKTWDFKVINGCAESESFRSPWTHARNIKTKLDDPPMEVALKRLIPD